MSSQTFSQPGSTMPPFFTQDEFRPLPRGADDDDDTRATPPEPPIVGGELGGERKVTASMLKFVQFGRIVRLTVFIEHTLPESERGVPAHIRMKTADQEEGKPVYAVLDTEQYRYKGPTQARDWNYSVEKARPYELRAVKIGSRCVVPLRWTPLPGAGGMDAAAIASFLAIVTKTYGYENDPRFTKLFGQPLAEDDQEATSWDYKLEALDMYSVHNP
ncbi:hypothetical protein AURDEDRAFT_176818 [Auricularia subglabra TFB-10046 SS5]|uniref:Uncharacterized protein n=1 Tax=Auricularia subglabra (strain TFB-10046 / SS5) TaxID=717982 RepID=J0LCA2_AURST|nr:hypothetical protein AURDEDRAFT_176818 [Auricularia subglabra TFB-10046 SS5]